MSDQNNGIQYWIYQYLLWILVATVGCSLGDAIYFGLNDLSFQPDVSWIFTLPLGLAISGVVMGFGQWYLLRDKISNAVRWGWSTAIGRFLGYPIGFLLAPSITPLILLIFGISDFKYFILFDTYMFESDVNEIIAMAIGGMVIGLLQYTALQRDSDYAILWIPISMIAWAFAMGSARWAINSTSILNYLFVFGLVEGIMYGLLSGIAFVIFLNLPRNKTELDNENNLQVN